MIEYSRLEELGQALVADHVPYSEDVIEKYQLKSDDLRFGVFCPDCGALPMVRQWGTWMCTQCGGKSSHAHIPALRDYALIFGEEITNAQAREFLKVDNPQVIKYLLKNMNLPTAGRGKGTRYILGGLV
ncbi:hypothetical protein [Alkalibacillus aidingensis]|uniref:hypothetical protein n=1 Tax=Alkalibacillus aidingensis TaxID=2747607 RepID=UPI0016610274|nr:hypothetical protein [Alkalibacillus aidingensis]